MSIEQMKESIINMLTPYLQKTDKAFDSELLESVVDGVFLDAKQIRRYPATYTEEMIERDMETGLGTFRNVTITRYNMIGVENEANHTEGEVSRKFIDFGKEWSGWNPLAVSI